MILLQTKEYLMNNIRTFLALLVFFSLASCTLFNKKPKPPSIQTDYADNFRINFFGKGAGAGMMMMGSMGPMGIAIGVAIDEGIAKDIRNALTASTHSVDAIIKESFIASWRKGCGEDQSGIDLCQASVPIHIRLDTLSFHSKGDNVRPNYAMLVTINGRSTHLSHTGVFQLSEAPTAKLEAMKHDGNITAKLLKPYFRENFDVLIHKALAQ